MINRKNLVLFFIVAPLFVCQNLFPESIPKAQKGILDLTEWNFEKDGIIPLDGEWEFYWKKLLYGFQNKSSSVSSTNKALKYISVPRSWNDFVINGQKLDGIGYATYRLKVLLPNDISSPLALKIPDIGTAYNLYVNGEKLAQVGNLSNKPKGSKAFYKPQVVYLLENKKSFEIVFQVSNYIHSQGGIWYEVYIGKYEDLRLIRERNLLLDLFVCGALLLMGFYHLGLFGLRKKDKSPLYFGLFCLLIAIRPLLTGEMYWYHLFPEFPWELGYRMDYLNMYIGAPLFIMFINSVFPKEMPKWVCLLIVIPSIILSLTVLLLPPMVSTRTLQFMQAVLFIGIIATVYAMVLAMIRKRLGAKAFFSGTLVFAIIVVNDILYTNGIIFTGYYVPFGFLFFVFSQAFFLSLRFSYAFIEVEELSENLEIKVIQRTTELEKAKKYAEEEHNKSEKLLLNILPEDVAEELKEKGTSEPILYESVSVLFTDFQGFTKIAESLTPQELIEELDQCFSYFDALMEGYGLEKLKTIGDSYMCAGGIPRRNNTHAIDCVLAAIEIQYIMQRIKEEKEGKGKPYWELRIGIHSGPLIAGVIGEKKFAYDVWGDTVNTASRMESSGTAGKVNISGSTFELIKEYFDCEYRGKVNAKNKGEVDMYYVEGLKRQYSQDGSGRVPNRLFWEKYEVIK